MQLVIARGLHRQKNTDKNINQLDHRFEMHVVQHHRSVFCVLESLKGKYLIKYEEICHLLLHIYANYVWFQTEKILQMCLKYWTYNPLLFANIICERKSYHRRRDSYSRFTQVYNENVLFVVCSGTFFQLKWHSNLRPGKSQYCEIKEWIWTQITVSSSRH